MAKPLTATDVFEGKSEVVQLIELLDLAYPPFTPAPGDTMETIMYRAGQRSVVDSLKFQYIEESDVHR